MKNLGKIMVIVSLGVIALTRCGGDDAESNPLSGVAPSLAISSPTMTSSTTTASYRLKFQTVRQAMLKFPAIEFVLKLVGVDLAKNSFAVEETTLPSDMKPLDTLKSEQAGDLVQSPTALAAEIGTLTTKKYDALCFNQNYNISNDANATVGQVMYGDGGIAYSTASSTDTTACMAAAMNAMMAGHPRYLNKMLKLISVMLSAGNHAGKTLPAVGETVDALANMPTIDGLTLTKASFGRLSDDASGNTVYKSEVEGTAGTATLDITLYHSPLNADNSNFKGLFQIVRPHTSTMMAGQSVVYEQQDGVLRLAMRGCANQNTASTDFFSSTTGLLDFSKTACQQDLNQIHASFNNTSGASIMHAAWQAGTGDGASRVTEIATTGNTEGSTGVGIFGYGKSINGTGSFAGPLPDNTSTPWASRMYCEWLNSLSGGTSINYVQKQGMTLTGGKWVVSSDNWRYAANGTCITNDTAWTIANHPLSAVNSTSMSGPTSLALVAPSTVTIGNVSVPTYTLP